MKDKKSSPAQIPESWKIPEEKIQEIWDKKSEEFAEFKKYFEEKFKK